MTEQGYKCPMCDAEHHKPHYAHKGQIDYKKQPLQEGRVKFNRVDSYGGKKYDTSWKDDLPNTGPRRDDNGEPNPLFCPHCGWEEEIIFIKNTA